MGEGVIRQFPDLQGYVIQKFLILPQNKKFLSVGGKQEVSSWLPPGKLLDRIPDLSGGGGLIQKFPIHPLQLLRRFYAGAVYNLQIGVPWLG